MKNYLIGAGIVAAVIASFFVGQSYAPVKLGGYTPPVQSASGFSQVIAASSTLAATSFCSPTSIQFSGNTAALTITTPAGTSTFAACANLVNNGASVSGLLVNDSTNTVTFANGTGVSFKCETVGVGSSTISGGCTNTGFNILATSTVQYTEYFDAGSSSLVFAVGNNFK